MGKRKSRKVESKGPAPKVDTIFDCPYCSRKSTVEVKIKKKEGYGQLWCRVCTVEFKAKLGPLTKEVDIYCEWIDLAEQLNSKKHKSFGLVDEDGSQDELDSDSDGGFGNKK